MGLTIDVRDNYFIKKNMEAEAKGELSVTYISHNATLEHFSLHQLYKCGFQTQTKVTGLQIFSQPHNEICFQSGLYIHVNGDAES